VCSSDLLLSRLQNQAAHVKDWLHNKLIEHKQYIVSHGEDMPEIRNWKWPYRNKLFK
jgi:xylulose-5-phosphate/fructose-6-phosphate phosphoketolase